MWSKVLIYGLLLAVILNDVLADQNDLEAKTEDLGVARRRKHRFGYGALFPFLGIGGLHAISALVAIKFKIVLIFIAVFATVFYGYKIYAGGAGCSGPVFHESSGPYLPFEGYSSHISPHSGPSYPSYPGADPYSAYSSDSSPPPSAVESSGPYRRISKQRSLDSSSNGKQNFDFGELAFTFLGVESEVCRKRFLCEMNVQYDKNPFVGLAYNMIGRQVFSKYIKEVEEAKPKSIKQCYELYKECKGPNDPPAGEEEEENSIDTENEARSASDVSTNSSENKPQLQSVPTLVIQRSKQQ